jgi:acetylornithine deacetylase
VAVATGRRLQEAVDEQRVISFARRVIGIPSPRFEEGPLADYLEGVMRGLGMETEFIPVERGGKKTKNVIGRLRGSRPGPTVILNAHTDTGSGQYRGLVFQPENWTKDPFAGIVEDGWLYGLGTHNNKQGIVSCLMAVDTLVRERIDFAGEIVLTFVVAETISGVGTQAILDAGLKGDMALVAEGTGLDIVTLSTGCVRGIITVLGSHEHHSRHRSAIELACKVVEAFGPTYRTVGPNEWLAYTPHPKLAGYPRTAIREIYSDLDSVRLHVDVVGVPSQTVQTIERDLRAFLAGLQTQIPDLRWDLQMRGWEPPFSDNTHYGADETSPDHPLVRAVAAAHSQVRGETPVVGTGRRLGAASDAQNFRNAGIPTIEYGPGSIKEDCGRWPCVDERVKVRDLVDAVRVVTVAVADLCR